MEPVQDTDQPAFRDTAQALEADAGGDSGAFDGLRGVLALWVGLGHICLSTTLRHNLGNAFAMPAFFILSGFVLVGGYGRTRWARLTWLGEKAEALPVLNVRRFLARRFARLAPVYYLTNLLWLPMFSVVSGNHLRTRTGSRCSDTFDGNNDARMAYGAVTTLLMVGTWVPFPGAIVTFNNDGWFVCTIFFCYLTFPSVLPYLQECSRARLQHWIWGCCMLQLLVLPPLYMLVFQFAMGFTNTAFNCGPGLPTYEHPLYRLPQFVLGVTGGLIRQAGPSLLGDESRPELISDWSETHAGWSRVVDGMALLIVAMVLLSFWFPVLAWSVLGFVYMGLTAPPFLMVLFGLTCDGGTSVLSRTLRQPWAKWLGTVSYSLYLSHTLVIAIIQYFIATGVGPVPTCTDDSDECKQLWAHLYRRRAISNWYAFPILAAALVLAWLTFTFVEEPTRTYLCRSLDESASTKARGTCATWQSFGSLAGKQPLADETAGTTEEAGQAALLSDRVDSIYSGAVAHKEGTVI